MAPRPNGSILMISLHGYVAGSPELGKPDTGGQVVFVLELAKRFARLGYKVDVLTRQFEDQPPQDKINPNLRVWRVPFGGKSFIRKEDMHDWYSDFVTNTLAVIRKKNLKYDFINSHYWDAGLAGQALSNSTIRTRSLLTGRGPRIRAKPAASASKNASRKSLSSSAPATTSSRPASSRSI